MDKLTSMAVFVRAVEAGSFAAAAQVLGISAPMVGKHVRFLEDRLGTQLLHRTTRRQSPTDAGGRFYERCKLLLVEVEAAEALARDVRAVPRGRLRVTAPVTFGAYSLMPMLARYMRQYPEVEVDLGLTDRVVDLVGEGYEAAIRISPLPDSGLMVRGLAPYRLVACAAPGYLARHGAPACPEELGNHECLGFAYWARPAAREWEFTDSMGVHRVRVRSRLQVNSGQALRHAALDGVGIILQAEEMLRDDLASGRLVRVLPDFEPPTRPMNIVFPRERRPTPKLRSFIDLVVATFG